ncbi:MAG: membrane protein insertase YidC [Nocardioides sp.]
MQFLGTIGHFILTPLYYAVSGILIAWHELFSLVLPSSGGMSWVLSIVGLTLVVRAALIPLFVKQIKSSRNMQLIQPKVKELQKKYGHDRERLAQETMNLYRETGTNPFAACLPLLVQSPIFIALFRLLDQAAKHNKANGFLSATDTASLKNAKLFGSMPISDTFLGTSQTDVKVLAAVLVVAMTATTFTTQRQLMSKNMPKDAMSGPYAQQQKMLLYVLPVAFAAGGVAFPIGVLVYWTTTNAWTMGQQFYVIRRNPAPGTPAFEAKLKRDRAKGKVTDVHEEEALKEAAKPEPPRQRQQPKKQTREQRRRAAGGRGPKRDGGGKTSGADPSAAHDDDTDEEKPA